MRAAVVALAALVMVGCPKKGPKPDPNPVPDGGGFVELDMGDEETELTDLMGSELMVATAQCGDLVKLEPAAMMGKLKDGEIRCLDASLKDAEKQTVKDKISRVLMSDAWAKGDKDRWEAIVRRHLTDIDRSDPDLCYKFSKHLLSKGGQWSDEAIRWADVALENKTVWTGDTYIKRVYALYKIKALAAQAKWQWLEAKAIEEPTADWGTQRDLARNELKTQAREWLEYARSSQQDPTLAQQLCVSAAGTAEFCE